MEKELRQIQQHQHWSDGTLLFFILRNLRYDEALLEALRNVAQSEQDAYARAEVHNVGAEKKKKKKNRVDRFSADNLPSPSR